MKNYNTHTYSVLGLVLLSGAVAFPHLSDAMQLGLSLDSKAQIENKTPVTDTGINLDIKSNTNLEVQKNTESNVKIESDTKAETRKNATATVTKDNTDARLGFFGKLWSSLKRDDNARNAVRADAQGNANLRIAKINVQTDANSAELSWKTNLDAKATLEYSTEADLSNSTTVTLDSNNAHTMVLADLDTNTTYYYKLTLTANSETKGEVETVKSGSLTTDATAEDSSGAPNLFWIRATSVTKNSAVIAWITLERATSKVWIESDTNVNTSIEPAAVDTKFSFFHKVQVNNLDANTTYHVKVASTDKDGNTKISTLHSFTTKVE